MSERSFDDLAKQAVETLSRRSSLLQLGGMALVASLAAPAATSARGRKGGGQRDRCSKSLKDKCRKVINEVCTAVFEEGPGECVTVLTPCCGEIDGCNIDDTIECVVEKINPPKA
ncbi:MAG: hypothetical protein U0031_01550 [Thermomicrobiales bacterium]